MYSLDTLRLTHETPAKVDSSMRHVSLLGSTLYVDRVYDELLDKGVPVSPVFDTWAHVRERAEELRAYPDGMVVVIDRMIQDWSDKFTSGNQTWMLPDVLKEIGIPWATTLHIPFSYMRAREPARLQIVEFEAVMPTLSRKEDWQLRASNGVQFIINMANEFQTPDLSVE